MEILLLLKNQYISIIFGGLGGIVTAWLTQRVLNKRGVFSYYVHHNKIGTSTQDAVFGNVSVTWNNEPIQHLFLSTLQLKNESFNDYENVVITTYTDTTILLSESTQVLNTPNTIEWTDKYRKRLHVESGQKLSDLQSAIYFGQREYLIPVFNRGETIKINYLNAAKSENIPSIWISATQKGVRIKHRIPQNLILGVSQSHAALVGGFIGAVGVIPLVIFISNPWIIAIAAITYGFSALIPGAYTIKLFRKLREIIGG